ncbi:oligomeric Golgi complex component [Tieghemostelium lacteum]|uniref:Conserved oligomeric Golgi complex subunit 4 n=1 Tax=Tieghemostelium lacteum TaxID=361077 RepID=A0A151ZDA1_TIELA|nr:oligomeric Golgi complex component [Tieghemostelium lacteum]|eukprot:KYQ91932.1 oligomeric Golgi complex component [Tieghemostelium lacteum]
MNNNSIIVDIKDLASNLSIEDAKKHLQSLINRDIVIENELQQYIKMKNQIESQMETFDFEIPEYLTLSYQKSKELNERINSTCTLAETLSSKVKYLDAIRERIKGTLKKVDDIVDLKNCIQGVQQSIDIEDYESAAFHINRYLNIDKEVLEQQSSEMLSKAEEKLLQMIENRYKLALEQENNTDVLRFSKLYVPLERAQEGLEKYCFYLQKHHTKLLDQMVQHYQQFITSQTNAQPNQKQIKPITAFVALRSVFKEFSAIIEENLDLIKQTFGISYCPKFLLLVSKQSDYYSSKIFDLFSEQQYQVSRNINEILSYSNKSSNTNSTSNDKIDPRNFAQVLDEMVMLSKSTKFYEMYLEKKSTLIKDDLKLEMNDDSVVVKFQQTMYSTVSKQKMNQMLGNYILLEEYFMVESVQKAINTDQVTPGKMTSSMVDYIFFVLQKSLQRALDSFHSQTLNVITNRLCRLLNQTKETLSRMFREQIIRASQKPTMDFAHAMVVLNDIETFGEYTGKLKKDFEVKSEKFYTQPDDKNKLVLILNDFSATQKGYSKLLQEEIDSLFKSIQPRLKNALFLFTNVNYEISNQMEYESADMNDPFVIQFTMEISQFLKMFQENMTTGNYDTIVHHTIHFILKKIESVLFQHKKFTLLGGFQFSKDLRTISTFFTKISTSTTRDKFSKLNQMASFLTLDSLSEVEDYWQENNQSSSWRLSPSELKKILLNRVDFSQDSILKLKL